VAKLPKTRSGKILRRTIRRIAEGDAYELPATLDDPTSLEAIERALGATSKPPAQA